MTVVAATVVGLLMERRDLSVEEEFHLLWPLAPRWGCRCHPRPFVSLPASLVGATVALDLYLG